MTPVAFTAVVRAVDSFRWRPELKVEEIGSPQRIAPHSLALEADVVVGDDDLASGRLIILHDPAGNDAWEGTTRCVAYARADVDFEMVTDRLLTDVGWSWLTEALQQFDAEFTAASGTVTTMSSRGYGGMAGEVERAEVEIRASWTPILDELGIEPHLAAWQELLCQTAGLEPLPEGIVSIMPRLNAGRGR